MDCFNDRPVDRVLPAAAKNTTFEPMLKNYLTTTQLLVTVAAASIAFGVNPMVGQSGSGRARESDVLCCNSAMNSAEENYGFYFNCKVCGKPHLAPTGSEPQWVTRTMARFVVLATCPCPANPDKCGEYEGLIDFKKVSESNWREFEKTGSLSAA
jgi:hypothetical protein